MRAPDPVISFTIWPLLATLALVAVLPTPCAAEIPPPPPAPSVMSPSVIAPDEQGDPEQEHYHQTGQFPEESTDSDGDGVPDIDDNCPGTQKGTPRVAPAGTFPAQVDSCGCPQDPCASDSDKDGVNDCNDTCPNTYAGHRIGAQGCPLPIEENERVQLDVKFEFDRAALQPGVEQDLLRVRALLLKYPEVSVSLEGHTDWKGSEAYNQRLSEQRAKVCRDFILADPRIAPERVSATGYGETKPLASNETEAGRAQNRRTVAEISGGRTIIPVNDQPPPLEGLAPEIQPSAPPPAAPR